MWVSSKNHGIFPNYIMFIIVVAFIQSLEGAVSTCFFMTRWPGVKKFALVFLLWSVWCDPCVESLHQ